MKLINLLDEKTINKIAAGEVVERPLSIIKEIVENSIDARATEVTIEVRKDPLKYIRISDNGIGIEEEDLELSFLRHATSKIKNIHDIECIRSLGFRGEALSSISAISKVEMITKTKDSDIGVKIYLEGGKVLYKEEAGHHNGTTITVKDIFFNTPARLKFLKSSSRELSSITDLVQKIALSNINLSIRYKIDDKLIFGTSGKGDLKEVIRTIYGKNIYENIIDINEEDEDFKVTGYIGNTSIVKGNRTLEIIFVNGRIIKSPLISSSVEKAYKSMLPINKFPFFILNIEINPRTIDVNVHPSKAEIKFQDDSLIFKKVYRAIKNNIEKNINIKDAFEEEVFKENVNYTNIETAKKSLEYKPASSDLERFILKENILPEKKYNYKKEIIEKENPIYKEKTVINNHQLEKNEEETFLPKEEKISSDKIPPLKILGQINSTFIIAEGENGMYIIDQHAAHERIYYEKYNNEFNNFSIKSQPLLVPSSIELTLNEKQLLLENLKSFERIGFFIEDFGGNSIAIREIPVLYGNPNINELFNEILEEVIDSKDKKITSCIDKVIYSMACKSAVKAGDNLNIKELEVLIENLNKCDSPYTCPHGRPTVIKMSYLELEKKFKRIQ